MPGTGVPSPQSSWRQLSEVLGSVLRQIEPPPGSVENAAASAQLSQSRLR